jgi:hypothetical protein
MAATIYLPPDVPSVILGNTGSRPDRHNMSVRRLERTRNSTEGMSVRHLDAPTERFCVAYGVFNVFIGMPRPAHPPNPRASVDERQADVNRDGSHVDARNSRNGEGITTDGRRIERNALRMAESEVQASDCNFDGWGSAARPGDWTPSGGRAAQSLHTWFGVVVLDEAVLGRRMNQLFFDPLINLDLLFHGRRAVFTVRLPFGRRLIAG